jgi:hypothetical protein
MLKSEKVFPTGANKFHDFVRKNCGICLIFEHINNPWIKMKSSGMLRRVALVTTEVWEERNACIAACFGC